MGLRVVQIAPRSIDLIVVPIWKELAYDLTDTCGATAARPYDPTHFTVSSDGVSEYSNEYYVTRLPAINQFSNLDSIIVARVVGKNCIQED